MSIFSDKQKADYTQTLHKGISFVRSLRGGLTDDTGSREENLQRLKDEIKSADAIVIGAGAGLSTAAGYTYSGARFERWFFDFKERLGLTDMYSGGFYPFPDDETRWAFWARTASPIWRAPSATWPVTPRWRSTATTTTASRSRTRLPV